MKHKSWRRHRREALRRPFQTCPRCGTQAPIWNTTQGPMCSYCVILADAEQGEDTIRKCRLLR